MQPDGHETKAHRLEATLAKLSDSADFEIIIETCYGAAIQYIALVCHQRLRKHLDTHKRLPSFLDDNGLDEVAKSFRNLELLRTSRYYGAQGDGTAAKEAKRILAEIKAKLH